MIGRITNQMLANTTLTGINQSLARLTATQQKLYTGKQINQPSDNPYGTSVALQMQGQLAQLTSYSNNVSDGTGFAQASSTALTNIQNVVQRVRELVVQAANGTLSPSNVAASAAEVGQLIEEVKQNANTQYNGQYIFSGAATSTIPYQAGPSDAYAGDTGQINRQIGPNTPLTINAQLSAVLGKGQTTAGQPAGDGLLLNTLRNVVDDMQSGNSSRLSAVDLSALDTNLNSLTGMQATVGAVQDRLQMASSRIQSLQLSDTQVLSSFQDADMAQTSIDYSTQQAALTAALQAGAHIVQQSLMNFLN